MYMRSPITYYGGKKNLVGIILNLMPPHKIYCEPFLGGGAVFWEKSPSWLEVINDINDNVINFYQVAQQDFESLQEKVRSILYSETLFWKAFQIYCHPNNHSNLDRAAAFWFSTNFSFAAKIGGGIKFDNGISQSHTGICMNRKKSEFVHSIQKRLAKVQISHRDALEVIISRDTPDTFFYLDPPYPGADQGHYKGYTTEDLENLLKILKSIKGKFILSNYRQNSIEDYARENAWEIIEMDCRLSAGLAARGTKRKREFLIMNFKRQTLFNY
jgi:DNA adenine methylase